MSGPQSHDPPRPVHTAPAIPRTPEAPSAPARLAVFLSGGGRTFENLYRHFHPAPGGKAPASPASIRLVVASRECPGAELARRLGVPTAVIPGDIPADRLESILADAGAHWAVLAGYVRLLPTPPSLAGRIVNIHPALLPDFGGKGMYGRRVHEAVIAAGRRVSGCTVHLCTDEYDRGRILIQRTCPVYPDDTAETLAARVFEQELLAYPEALELLLSGRVQSVDQTDTAVGRTSG